MGFLCGIVGLPNAGKSTLFNALTSAGAPASNYPFCTIEPNVGIVTVPDSRLDYLAPIVRSAAVVPSVIEFVDIAGLVRGASNGEGLGNQFLARIREVDAIAHVIRCFDDPNVAHVDGSVGPVRDIEIVEAELILKDLETVEHRLADVQRRAKSGDAKSRSESEVCEQIRHHLLAGKLARSLGDPGAEGSGYLRDLHLLTAKPVMYVCNVHEKDASGECDYVRSVRVFAAEAGGKVVTVSAKVESEIAELPLSERAGYRASLGLQESGLATVIRAGYDLLDLVTFFTANERELHAWTIRRGTRAPAAAGLIHTDFERGFIRAEVMKFTDIQHFGSDHGVREAGLLRLEGKDYIVGDGDLIYFRFSP